MSEKNANKGRSSAGDIIDAIAQDMGVDEETESPETDDSAEDATAEPAKAEPAPVAKKGDGKAAGKGDGKGGDGKAAGRKESPKAATPAPEAPAAEPFVTNEEALTGIFEVGPKESIPGDPLKSPLYDAEEEEAARTPRSSPKTFAMVFGGSMAVLLVGFLLLPSGSKADVLALLAGRDIIEEREARARALAEEERKQKLANAPKFGTIEIVTAPNNLLLRAVGQPTMIVDSGGVSSRPTRTKISFQDISVKEPFRFVIDGEGNYETQEISIPSFGDPSSPWTQSFTGDYSASFVLNVKPLPARAVELEWRRAWRPSAEKEESDLTGTVTLVSNPPGARIRYNGADIVDPTTGELARTPFTFNSYPAPATAKDQTPRPLLLSREGHRVELALEGKVPVVFGLYRHQYVCEPKPGVAEPTAPPAKPGEPPMLPDFSGYCNYTFSTTIDLQDPPPPPKEGSGEQAAAPETK